jgi:hypothetical protein
MVPPTARHQRVGGGQADLPGRAVVADRAGVAGQGNDRDMVVAGLLHRRVDLGHLGVGEEVLAVAAAERVTVNDNTAMRLPPVRWFLIETGSPRRSTPTWGRARPRNGPQTGRPVEYPRIGPREQCTCVRAIDVPEFVHGWECPLNPARQKPSERGPSGTSAGVLAPGDC